MKRLPSSSHFPALMQRREATIEMHQLHPVDPYHLLIFDLTVVSCIWYLKPNGLQSRKGGCQLTLIAR